MAIIYYEIKFTINNHKVRMERDVFNGKRLWYFRYEMNDLDVKSLDSMKKQSVSYKLHMYDCLRANKSLWGIEGRVPFLDKAFLCNEHQP